MADVFEVLTASESEQKIAKQAAADTLSAAVYDVREKFGAHLFCAKSKDEFHDRLALCKDDMMKTVNGHLMPVTGVMRRICKTMEREWREKIAVDTTSTPSDIDPTGMPRGASRRRADATGPDQNIQETFSPSDGPLVPSGDFAAYLNSVDQGAPAQVQRDFAAAKGKKSEDNDYGADFDRQFGGYEEGGWRDSLDGMIDSVKLRDRSKESRRRTANEEEGWDTNALQRDYEVEGFSAPYVVVRRKSDGQRGTLEFNRGSKYTGEPRIYRNFIPHTAAFHRMAIDGTGGVPAATPAPMPAPGSGGNMSVGGGGNVNMSPPGFNLPDSGNGSSDVMDNGQGIQGGASMIASVVKRYAQWCVDNLARPSTKTLEYYAANRPDREYFVLTSALQRHADNNSLFGTGGEGNNNGPSSPTLPAYLDPASPVPAPSGAGAAPAESSYSNKQAAGGYTDPFASAVSGTPTPAQAGVTGLGGPGKSKGKGKPPGGVAVNADAVKNTMGKMPPSQTLTTARRTAGNKDYLQQADEAITNLLNEKAQEFQEGIQPLQQALQTIQYAQQVQQANNPMNVMPPAGTVNVLPQGQAPQGPAPQGVDPSGQVDPAVLQQLMGMGGMDPSMGGGAPQGDPSQQSGPPPAAADQGAVPPELAQQIQARRRQGASGNLDVPPAEYKRRGRGSWPSPSGGDHTYRPEYHDGRHQELTEDDWGHDLHVTRVDGKYVDDLGNHREWQDPKGEVEIDGPQETSYKGKHRSEARRRTAKVDLSEVRIEDGGSGLFSGKHPAGHRVVFQASPEDTKKLKSVMFGDLGQNFSGVTVDESDIVDHGREARRTARRGGGYPKA